MDLARLLALAAIFLTIITPGMMTGSFIVIVGTALVTGFNPAALLLRRASGNA